jgi:hypothetical protein
VTIQPFATEEEAGSKQTRQLIRNKGDAYRGSMNDKNSLQGNIAELGNNVYQYGTRDQGKKVHQNDRGDRQLYQKRV